MDQDDNPYRVPQSPLRPTFEVTVDEVTSRHARPNWRVFATVCMCIFGMLYGAGAFRMLFFGGNRHALYTPGWPERIVITLILILFSLFGFLGARGWYQGRLKSAFVYSLLGSLPFWLAIFGTLFGAF
ncbi:MAG: hypothetical protein SGJ19_04185 [Planctomycetia bacterium]|nr:hypothetical protein [Planctomycetia bacterium]